MNICIQGDESKDPHFHIYDHKNRVDYCIGIYDGLPRQYTTFNLYSPGVLNNDQLKALDEWKEERFRPDLPVVQSNWDFIADMFDRISDDWDILENHEYGMEIPQYHK